MIFVKLLASGETALAKMRNASSWNFNGRSTIQQRILWQPNLETAYKQIQKNEKSIGFISFFEPDIGDGNGRV